MTASERFQKCLEAANEYFFQGEMFLRPLKPREINWNLEKIHEKYLLRSSLKGKF